MHVHLYAYRCISRMQGYSRNCDNGCKEGHEVCGDFLPLYIFYWCCVLEPVVVLNSKTKQTKLMPQNFLEFLAVVLQFFLQEDIKQPCCKWS